MKKDKKLYIIIDNRRGNAVSYTTDRENAIRSAYDTMRTRNENWKDNPSWSLLSEEDKKAYIDHVFGPYAGVQIREGYNLDK